MKCCILQCGAKKNKLHPKLSLHKLPSNKSLKKKWLQIIGPENINPGLKYLYVCSLHFVEASFNRTLDVVRLHDGAVPSILIPAKTNVSHFPMPQSTRFMDVKLLHDSQNQDAQIVDQRELYLDGLN